MLRLFVTALIRLAVGFLPAVTVPILAQAEDVIVAPGGLHTALDAAHSGDRLLLQAGEYAGPVIVKTSVMIDGQGKAVIDGQGRGTVILVSAPDVTIRNIHVRNSGIDLSEQDSGIFVEKTSHRTVIERNILEDNLIGIYLSGPENAVVRNNIVRGRRDLRVNERGNGIQLWNTPGSKVLNNRIYDGRDGIFVTTSKNNQFIGNEFNDLRFAVHYMYTNHSEVRGNRSYGNDVGYALMYSKHLTVKDNLSQGDRDHGILLNYANSSEIGGNAVMGGTHKCVFIYNSNKNRFRENLFQECDIGIHFTAGSERNEIVRNAFNGNRTQVKYVGTRWLDWSQSGVGNYWSDHTAFDLDGDKIADQPYRPNDLVDQVVWAHPLAKLLLNAPSVQILKWAQGRFPALHPGGVIDSAPLMVMPSVGALAYRR